VSTNPTLYNNLLASLGKDITLVAVSKTKSIEEIQALYDLGQKDFGENYVQELVDKYATLPKDINWHFIGHLQSNKVKLITPFISLIQSVDSFKLLKEINKQAEKNKRMINCLLQVYIASEETKFGIDETELAGILNSKELESLKNIRITGLMGMASFTGDKEVVKKEFSYLKLLFDKYSNTSPHHPLKTLSMGMSADYQMAITLGSTMVRIGSLLFGERVKL